jgi:hypothetical protein
VRISPVASVATGIAGMVGMAKRIEGDGFLFFLSTDRAATARQPGYSTVEIDPDM